MNAETPRCDKCGQLVSRDDVLSNRARHVMVEPDSHFGPEVWETLCAKCGGGSIDGKDGE